MSTYNFTLSNSGLKTYRLTLSNQLYFLTVRYNSRADRWFIDLRNASSTEYIFRGLKLLPNGSQTKYNCAEFTATVGEFFIYTNYGFSYSEDDRVTENSLTLVDKSKQTQHTLSFTTRDELDFIMSIQEGV